MATPCLVVVLAYREVNLLLVRDPSFAYYKYVADVRSVLQGYPGAAVP